MAKERGDRKVRLYITLFKPQNQKQDRERERDRGGQRERERRQRDPSNQTHTVSGVQILKYIDIHFKIRY